MRRSRSDRIFAGVCGGLARYLGIDPLLIRLAFVLIAILMGSGLLLYIVLWVLIPLEDVTDSAAGSGRPS